jgi:hypothetical protein
MNGTPLTVVSNEIVPLRKQAPQLGAMRFALDLQEGSGITTEGIERLPGPECSGPPDSMACKIFHYRLRNLTGHTLILYRWTCTPDEPWPQIKQVDGTWKDLEPGGWICTRNFLYPVVVRAGEALETDFQLGLLRGAPKLNPVRLSGEYRMRVRLEIQGCFASPDGSFCLETVRAGGMTISNELQVRSTGDGSADRTR